MRKASILFLALTGAAPVVWSADLAGLYQDALSKDAQYAAARAQFAAVEERLPQSFATTFLPAVTLNANSAWNVTNGNGLEQNYNSNGYSVSLSQPLIRYQNNLSHDQTKRTLAQAQAQLTLARQDLILRLSQAYFDVLYAQDHLDSLQAQRQAIAEQLAATTRKFEIGTAAITDVRDAKARHDLVKAQVIAAGNDLEAKRQGLRVLTRQVPASLAGLRPGLSFKAPTPNDMDAWARSAETAGMPVVAAQASVDIARLESRKARAAHYPTLDLNASRSKSKSSSITTVGTDLWGTAVGLQFSLPLFNGGGPTAHQREVVALLDKAQAELDGAQRSGALAARQAFLGVTSGLAQIQALEEALASAKVALEANQRGLEIGVRVDIDVLNAQQQYAATERDLAKSRYDTLLALLRLKAAAGSLGDADVKEVNALLKGS